MSEDKGTSNNKTRREFIKTGIAGGIAAISLPTLSFARGYKHNKLFSPLPFELDEVTVSELADGFKAGRFTVRSIAELYISRINEIDKTGPALNSVIELNPEALSIADSLDKELKEKGPRSYMHGIPVLIKDNIDTADKMMTTAGSLALLGSRPSGDAFIVSQLRNAGALILGKTNLSEWANIRSTHSTSGWSARGGLTKNPYALDRNTSGSSSGSGAALSANLCAVAIGTETDGSVVSPSSLNGVVGIKPTVGLVSRTGIIPISHSQDTAGPMARTVKDAAILLGAMAGIDPEDDATRDKERVAYSDYTKFLSDDGLKGTRIGIVRKYFGFLPSVDKIMESSLEILRKNGAVLIDPVEIESLGKFDDSELTVLLYELKADMKAYLDRRGNDKSIHTLKDIIEFNKKHESDEMPYFKQELFLQAEEKGPLTDDEYIEALVKNHRLTRDEGIDLVMDKYNLDALVAPTDSPAWMTDLVDGDHFLGGCSSLAAVAGYPHITVPAGFVFGLPIGISFFGRAWSESELLNIAYGFEQVSKARRKPEFLPTVNLKS